MSALQQTDTWKEYVENNCGLKQAVNLNEVTDPLDTVDETINIEVERESKSESTLMREASSMASMAVITIDLLVSNVAGAISGGEREKYKLSSTEKAEYTEVWANFLKDKNIELSPTAMLLIVSACIVVPKLVEANKERKEKKLLKTQENTINTLETEIKTLKKKLNNAGAGKSSEV
jgi:chaperonin cofactor prefoldin